MTEGVDPGMDLSYSDLPMSCDELTQEFLDAWW